MNIREEFDLVKETFGEVISNARREKKLTLREAAKRVGISHPYFSQLEKNKNRNPSLNVLYKIAYELDTSFAYLMLLSDIEIGYTIEKFNDSDLEFIKNQKNNVLDCSNYAEFLIKYKNDFDLKERPMGISNVFNYLEAIEAMKKEIKKEMLSSALKSLNTFESDSITEGFQKPIETSKKQDELVFKSPLLKQFKEAGGEINHKIEFILPAYKSETSDGVTFTSFIPIEEAVSSFYDIENFLLLNNEINYKGKKLSTKDKEQILSEINKIIFPD